MEFHRSRTRLQKEFFQAACQSGKPRGLVWIGCEFGQGVLFVREKQTGKEAALVSVLISFDAIPGSDMENLEALYNIRTASAVFFYHDGNWHTTGRAIFNLDPEQAVVHLGKYYDRVAP